MRTYSDGVHKTYYNNVYRVYQMGFFQPRRPPYFGYYYYYYPTWLTKISDVWTIDCSIAVTLCDPTATSHAAISHQSRVQMRDFLVCFGGICLRIVKCPAQVVCSTDIHQSQGPNVTSAQGTHKTSSSLCKLLTIVTHGERGPAAVLLLLVTGNNHF
ncbi:hypothetical protein BGW80DRAFT_471854 [Lactifluus volemus]|nr:hypothetical protein BGW80DRAFT_471854 [Lactifluus volemus]